MMGNECNLKKKVGSCTKRQKIAVCVLIAIILLAAAAALMTVTGFGNDVFYDLLQSTYA